MISKPNRNNETEPTEAKPWNQMIQKARQGDPDALQWCCREAKLIITAVSHIPYFRIRLGEDEARSAASFALLEYVTGTGAIPPDAEVPRLLKRIMRCEILDTIRGQTNRERFEQPDASLMGCAAGEETSLAELLAADSCQEPDARTLQQELRNEMQTAIQRLTSKEQQVIRSLYFYQKSATETAQDMQCTARNVRWLRKNALGRLRAMVARRVNV